MSYRLKQSKENSIAAWICDSTSTSSATPYPDHSGSGRTGYALAAVPTAAPLVAGASFAPIFNSTAPGVFVNRSNFRQGFETKSFALEAWVYPVVVGKQTILSHSGVYDGLWIENNIVHFSTNYITAGAADASFDIKTTRAIHVVGVHNANQNRLYVDGVLVDTVNLTAEQKNDSYNPSDVNLYAGPGTSSTSKIAVNAVALYNFITPEAIRRNFMAGRAVVPQANIPPQFDGIPLYLDAGAGDVYFEREFINREEFVTGYGNNVNFEDTRVSPRLGDNRLSIASSWSAAFPLDIFEITSIYGIFVEWSALNVTVEARINTGSWTALTNRRLITGIGPAYATTDKLLEIRVTFPAGVAANLSFLESLSIVGFQSNTFDTTESRSISVSYPGVPRKDYEPIEYNENNGVYLDGGTLTIAPDTSETPEPVYTIEIWAKIVSGTLTRTGITASASWTNAAGGAALQIGQWGLFTLSSATDLSGVTLTFSGDVIIGQIALYPTALTQTQVTQIYKCYTGVPVLSFTDTGSIGIAEVASPVTLSIRDWAVEAGS